MLQEQTITVIERVLGKTHLVYYLPKRGCVMHIVIIFRVVF